MNPRGQQNENLMCNLDSPANIVSTLEVEIHSLFTIRDHTLGQDCQLIYFSGFGKAPEDRKCWYFVQTLIYTCKNSGHLQTNSCHCEVQWFANNNKGVLNFTHIVIWFNFFKLGHTCGHEWLWIYFWWVGFCLPTCFLRVKSSYWASLNDINSRNIATSEQTAYLQCITQFLWIWYICSMLSHTSLETCWSIQTHTCNSQETCNGT